MVRTHSSITAGQLFKTRSFLFTCSPMLFLSPLIIFLFLLAGSPAARANDVYIAQNAAGAGSGAACADALPASSFNSPSNWGSAGKIGPGTTVHLCGTISTQLTVQGGGSLGSPITIFFEPNAQIALPACDNSNGCLYNNGFGYLIIDGGSNGVIRNTDNGSSLGHAVPTYLIQMHNCIKCEIKNLALGPAYVHSSLSDTHNTSYVCIYTSNSSDPISYHVHHNICKDANQGFDYAAANGDAGAEFDHNTFYNTNGSINPANTGSSHLTNMLIHDNTFGSHANWGTTGCSFHADDIHAYGQNGGTGAGIQVYNNVFNGDMGSCPTSQVFFEDSINNSVVFNNLFLPSAYGNESNGIVNINGANNAFYNNTIIGQLVSGDLCFQTGGRSLPGTITVENNIMSSCNTLTVINSGMVINGWDYNIYGGKAGGQAFHWINVANADLPTWRTNCSCDAHSQFGASTSYAGVDSTGRLLSSSPAILWGNNLSSLGIPPLDSDYAGVARPGPGACTTQGKSSACWDAGGYSFGSSTAKLPNAPTGLQATVQ